MSTAPLSPPTATSIDAREVVANLASIRARIDASAAGSGRDGSAVTLVAVSKTVALEQLRVLLATDAKAGAHLHDLGENRVQEATQKIAALGRPPRWHLIGHLQQNKAKAAVGRFDLIHSVDSNSLAETLDRVAVELAVCQRVLLQVNVAGEESKGGYTPDEVVAAAARLALLPGLTIEGLMTIAPQGAVGAELRRVFAELRGLHEHLAPVFMERGHHWQHLSMGMTDDFETAIDEGATLVRVGRAIFGERPAPATTSAPPQGQSVTGRAPSSSE